ncbi:MAG: TaqI-like C-terminal specificity domain-containing protein [Candidatus Omnitrophica bacterium]|nr:TaqI-like C-terminal specificity domain-containing protein [Candidatus Omnitrophota bacterium]
MDKKQAQALIKETFESTFDKGRFVGFVKNLLNDVEEATFMYKGNYIPDAYEQYINTLERIGKYTDGEHKIDILIAKLKKETSIERARTMQRNFVAWYLNGSRGGELKDAALVAFVAPNDEDWRFSLVKMDYRFEEGKKGRMRVKEEFTPARRWSFLVGINENSHTAQSQLVDLVADDERNPDITQLEEAFNIEKVTKEFFEKYRELFLWTEETLEDIVKKDKKIKGDFEDKKINIVDFSKKLLGQIVFLYFLQKKGWFGVKRDADWGTGPKGFLRELFESKHGSYKNFFNDILEPLFYEALRIDRSHDDDYYSKLNCRIPFLNGGLFDPINNYDWVHTDILLPNDLFSNSYKTKEGDTGNGILDIFDRYNFTVKEDEPLEKEVAVDPEMLGKVFENLLEVKDRKSKGTYYTPREIVHYMCQQSVINYLATELEGNVPMEDIETLIKHGEHLGENETIVEAKGRETNTYFYKLPEGIRQNAELIDKKLIDIKVCDPAIGSGAFPVGMMGEIVKTRNVLTAYIKGKDRTIYNFKRECIEKSLYGVDIDPGAVEIAKLRLWLSLVVEEEDIKQIKPLPNLDYKIVCGNSLMDVEKNLFNQSLFDDLERLKPLLFNETSPKRKLEYKKKIDDLIKEITNNNQNFDFEVYFSEVYHGKKGFDVVIANPPYVSYGLRGGQKMLTKEKDFLKRKYPNSAEYKISLYAVFMDKAIRICKQNGGLQTFIVPDSFLLGRYFSKIRKFILRTNEIVSVLLLPYSVFDATVGFSVVYLFQKKSDVNPSHKITARFAEDNKIVQDNTFKSFSYEQNFFNELRHNRFRLFFDQGSMNLVSKIERDTVELGSVVKFSSGLIGKNGQDSIISDSKKGEKWLKGIISGGEINKYTIFPAGNYLLYDKGKIKSGYECVDYFKEKLFVRQTGDSLICAYDKDGLLALNNVHIGNLIDGAYSLKFITAIINSKLLNYYYKSISLETGRVMAQTDIETVETLPIKRLASTEQKSFIEIVDSILVLTKSSGYQDNSSKQAEVREHIKKLDKMIFKLYELTDDEIKRVKVLFKE